MLGLGESVGTSQEGRVFWDNLEVMGGNVGRRRGKDRDVHRMM